MFAGAHAMTYVYRYECLLLGSILSRQRPAFPIYSSITSSFRPSVHPYSYPPSGFSYFHPSSSAIFLHLLFSCSAPPLFNPSSPRCAEALDNGALYRTWAAIVKASLPDSIISSFLPLLVGLSPSSCNPYAGDDEGFRWCLQQAYPRVFITYIHN